MTDSRPNRAQRSVSFNPNATPDDHTVPWNLRHTWIKDKQYNPVHESNAVTVTQNEPSNSSRRKDGQNKVNSFPKECPDKLKETIEHQKAPFPIVAMPVEILIHIFDCHRGSSPPKRSLGLVCKSWRDIILGSPTLWTHLTATFVAEDELVTEQTRLQRRIDLSRNALLDVAMDTRRYYKAGERYDLFKMIASTGVERWKSLKLWYCETFYHITCLDQIFTEGRFTSLRQLRLLYPTKGSDPFSAIGRLIIRSKPTIYDLQVTGGIPDIYRDPDIFQHTRTVTGNSFAIEKLRGLISLEEISLNSSKLANIDLFPPLPSRATFNFLRRSQLMALNRTNVQYLMVDDWHEDAIDTTVDFPNLTTLTLKTGLLTDIQKISAPRLHTLTLGGDWGWDGVRVESLEDGGIIEAFTKSPTVMLLKPTTLSLYIELKTEALVLALETWSQLEHLTLMFHKLTPKGVFFSRLTDQINPICPQLIDLSLDSSSFTFKGDIPDWEDLARRMFEVREYLPLHLIRWRWKERFRSQSNPWYNLSRDSWL